MRAARVVAGLGLGVALAAGACTPGPGVTDDAGMDAAAPLDPLARLRAASSTTTSVVLGPTGTIAGLDGRIEAPGATPAERVDAFLREHGPLFGIDDPTAELGPPSSHAAHAGGDVVVRPRLHRGVPVFGAGLRVIVGETGTIDVVMSSDPGELTLDVTPSITAAEARTSAARAVAPEDPSAGTTEPVLVVLEPAMLLSRIGEARLAWQLDVAGVAAESRATVFVDATQDGPLLVLPRVHSELDRSVRDARLQSDMSMAFAASPVVIEEIGESLVDPPDDEARALFGRLGDVDAFFRDRFGLDHWSGQEGRLLEGLVHFRAITYEGLCADAPPECPAGRACFDQRCAQLIDQGACAAAAPLCETGATCQAGRCVAPSTHSNAFFDASTDAFWFTDGMAALDVTAHEVTHGLTQAHAGIVYAAEPGALNESLSDVLAAFVDTATPWTIGDGSRLGVFRDLRDPSARGAPSHYDGLLASVPTGPCAAAAPRCPVPAGADPASRACIDGTCVDLGEDSGHVHTNSQIAGHAAFLLVEGGDGSGDDADVHVEGIGALDAERLYFGVVRSRLLSQYSTFATLRFALAAECRRIVRAARATETITREDCASVLDAFAAVGIGLPDSDDDAFDDGEDTCPGMNDPLLAGERDLCAMMSRPDAGLRDASETDSHLWADAGCTGDVVPCPVVYEDARGRSYRLSDDLGCVRDDDLPYYRQASCSYRNGLLEPDDQFAAFILRWSLGREVADPWCTSPAPATPDDMSGTTEFHDFLDRIQVTYVGPDNEAPDVGREAFIDRLMDQVRPFAAPCEPLIRCPTRLDDGTALRAFSPSASQLEPRRQGTGSPPHYTMARCGYEGGFVVELRWAQDADEVVPCNSDFYDAGTRVVSSLTQAAQIRFTTRGVAVDDAIVSQLGGLLGEIEPRALACP